MRARRFFAILTTLTLFLLAGCGGDQKPVNEGLDRPVQKKDKDK